MKRTIPKLFRLKLATVALALTGMPMLAAPQPAFEQPVAPHMIRRKPVQNSAQTVETAATLAAGCALLGVGLAGRKRRTGRS